MTWGTTVIVEVWEVRVPVQTQQAGPELEKPNAELGQSEEYSRKQGYATTMRRRHFPQPSWSKIILNWALVIVGPYILWVSILYAAHWFGIGRKMRRHDDAGRLLCRAASVFPLQYVLAWPLICFTWGALIFLDKLGFLPLEHSQRHYRIYRGLQYGVPAVGWVLAIVLTWVSLRNNVRRLKRMLECSGKEDGQ